jgi:hypothetical protein
VGGAVWDTGEVVPRVTRILGYGGAAVGVALGALVVAGVALEDRTRRGVAERIAESLRAEATIDRGSLALVRGGLDLEELAAHRDDAVGHLALRVAEIHCALPPLGLALVDRDCRELAVRGMRLEVSAAALFRLQPPRRPPLHARGVAIDDAQLVFSPSALAPGLGRVAIEVAHAEAGDTTFKTPVSWLFALRALQARIELPAGIALDVSYDRGELRIAGGILGAAPLVVPLALPVADPADDAHAEVARLVALGKDIAAQLVAQRAADWLDSKLSP